MPEGDPSPEQLKVQVEVWPLTTPQLSEEFLATIAPHMRSLKERSLRLRTDRTEEQTQLSLQYLENRLRALKEGDAVLTARNGSNIIGFVLLRWDEQEKRTKVEQFYVEANLRSKGVGTKILVRALEYALRSHSNISQGVFLSTDKNTPEKTNRARKLYEDTGFHVSSVPGDVSWEDRFDLDFGTEQKSV